MLYECCNFLQIKTNNRVDTHGLTPVALKMFGPFYFPHLPSPMGRNKRNAFTHGLTPVVLSVIFDRLHNFYQGHFQEAFDNFSSL